MKLTGNTILVTGGGSGIGSGLATEFHKLGNEVIIAGRRKSALEETVAANPGMKARVLDISDATAVRRFSAQIASDYPALNVLINNAGIMRMENLRKQQSDLKDAESIVATNLLGPIRLTAALLPLLESQPAATVMNVSSGLAFVPLHTTPTYCATKAALHSYTQTLRYQLRSTQIEVLELIPPYVATDLLNGRNDPRAMPLPKFIEEVMAILKAQPEAREICVENVKGLRLAAEKGVYENVFNGLNASVGEVFEQSRQPAAHPEASR